MSHKEDISQYILSLLGSDTGLSGELLTESQDRDDIQPFTEPETLRLITLFIRLLQAQRVLELGTGIGYSTIVLAEALKATGGLLVTVDNHAGTTAEAAQVIERSGLGSSVRQVFADARTAVPDMAKEQPGSYDLVFQDCGKYLYPLLYDDIYTLLRPGGILVTDDVLFRFNPNVRKGLGRYTDAYNTRLFADSRYCSALLPVGDGAAFSLKLG
jgi:predicted O-methyltransferase YrrM